MSDDKKKKGVGKFLKIFACLLFVAIVVGVVLLFVPTDSSSLVGVLTQTSQSKLLDDSKSRQEYTTFTNNLKNNSRLRVYELEISAVKESIQVTNNVIDFYAQYIKFAKSNRVFKNNNGKAKTNLQNAMSEGKDMMKIASDNIVSIEVKETYLRSAWLDYRHSFINYLEYCSNAFESLYNIYDGCFDEGFTVNKAMLVDLQAVNDYLQVITSDFKQLEQKDKLNTEIASYSYTGRGKVLKFQEFVGARLRGTLKSGKYYLDNSVRQEYDKLITYLQENSFSTVIQSITAGGDFPQGETSGIEYEVKKYLGGI